MADKLDWLNKHLVHLRYVYIKDLVEKEGYKIRADHEDIFAGETGIETVCYKLYCQKKFKTICEIFAYNAQKRASIWWGYRCVLSLEEELRINPVQERDIATIGAKLEPEVPDWAKIEAPGPTPEDIAEVEKMLADAQIDYDKMRAKIDPEVLGLYEEVKDVVYEAFREQHGSDPMEALTKMLENLPKDPRPIDPNSPVFVEAAKLKAQIGAMQKETVDMIKSVLPTKIPAHQNKLRDNALDAVFRWVAAPNPENSQKCLDVGNECPDTPAGLLAVTAFWAFGDLLPMGEQTVPTPPGLAANGLSQVLLLCALHPGGTRKLKERYEEYHNLAMEVLGGADTWEDYVAAGKAPHEGIAPVYIQPAKMVVQEKAEPEKPDAEKPDAAKPGKPDEPPAYNRWKPI